ncbi:hypothetical protein BDFB_011428, partial [Asbolus verrucosus]
MDPILSSARSPKPAKKLLNSNHHTAALASTMYLRFLHTSRNQSFQCGDEDDLPGEPTRSHFVLDPSS